FLEGCGYMSRIAFVLDRLFCRFGLSGKSFIPILVGTGCGVSGIMASRTIENEQSRRMTVITTTFIPCSAKMPMISMIAGALLGGSPLAAVSAYFIGAAAIIFSGIILKKTKLFSSKQTPFVMELPPYHWPGIKNILRSMWDRVWEFIKKAGTVILISSILIWFITYFGVVNGSFRMLAKNELDHSILAAIGGVIAPLFAPLGWGNWQAAVAAITGLVAKENIVGTLSILFGSGSGALYPALAEHFTPISGYSFLIFNLLCAPCFAAMGAIRQEMNDIRWTVFAIAYQCGLAYAVSLIINQFGRLFTGQMNGAADVVSCIAAAVVCGFLIYMIVRPDRTKKGDDR
ncbi:MAG: ferrous iron transporter B, partial [Eubacterium sp.]|nr:ferrous iron transporter B [Eubacterium sp.]